MDAFFHPEQLLHHPKSYYSRGQMRTPQEIPERTARLLAGVRELGFPVIQPNDYGMTPLLGVHDISYLRFLESAHRQWKKMPADWGDEDMSNIFVRGRHALPGILAEAARYRADGSCPLGESPWRPAAGPAQGRGAGGHAFVEAR